MVIIGIDKIEPQMPGMTYTLCFPAFIFLSLIHILSTAVGAEGGFAPSFKGTEDAIETILAAIERAGYRPGTDIKLALECASSAF